MIGHEAVTNEAELARKGRPPDLDHVSSSNSKNGIKFLENGQDLLGHLSFEPLEPQTRMVIDIIANSTSPSSDAATPAPPGFLFYPGDFRLHSHYTCGIA